MRSESEFFCPRNLDMFLSGVGSFSLFVDVSTYYTGKFLYSSIGP
jgi:hypothetical protein